MRTAYTLFSGGGGADIGLRNAGYMLTGGVEYDARIAAVYARNLGHALTVADIRSIDPALLPVAPPTWLHASPVCKNFSTAKTDGVEDEGDIGMADATVRFLDAWQPPTFSLEQVWAYRDSVSFGRITDALRRLGYSFDFWHLNAASYGVPQTRRRLVLLARRGTWRIQRPNPTHRDGGDFYSPPWVGWYAAISDIIHTLPPSQFAAWQLARLPELAGSVLVSNAGNNFEEDKPLTLVQGDQPTFSVTTQAGGRVRAFIVDCQNNGAADADGLRGLTIRDAAEPCHTVTATATKRTGRAFLVNEDSKMGIAEQDQPAFTVVSSHRSGNTRAWLSRGKVVRMNLRALCRFQSFPDWYEPASTVEIGNAIPPLLMQRLAESVL